MRTRYPTIKRYPSGVAAAQVSYPSVFQVQAPGRPHRELFYVANVQGSRRPLIHGRGRDHAGRLGGASAIRYGPSGHTALYHPLAGGRPCGSAGGPTAGGASLSWRSRAAKDHKVRSKALAYNALIYPVFQGRAADGPAQTAVFLGRPRFAGAGSAGSSATGAFCRPRPRDLARAER